MMYILTQEEYDILKDKDIAKQVDEEVNRRLRKFGKRMDELVREARLKSTPELYHMANVIKNTMADVNIPEVHIIHKPGNSRGEII